jgi:putative flavoprotein involved in K+ transport
MTVTADPGTQRREVVVIGGGQAGLAVGYFLAQQNRRFTILEATSEPAAAWRSRWDSLRLFTPVRYDSLPGLAFPGDPDSYPSRDAVIAYLTDYAQRFELPVEFDSRVQAVRARDGHGFVVELAERSYEADQVVVATGPFQVPFTPPMAAELAPAVVQLHSSRYRSPVDLPTGTVLVVGGGNTGYQISEELAQSRDVHLAIGARQTPLPQRILGRDLFRYLQATGLMNKTVDSRLAQRLKDKETLIGSSPRAARKTGIQTRPRATSARAATVTFAVQIAKAFGAEVTGVSSAGKLDAVRAIGADHVVDYRRDDFLNGAHRYDVILDIGGTRRLSQLRGALTPEGTLVLVGGMTDGRWLGGTERLIRARMLSPLVGHKLRTFVNSENARDLEVLRELIESGRVTPAVDRTFPLSETIAAIRYLLDGHARGKIAITVGA